MRAAQSCALNRLVKASSKVEVDVNAAEKLMIGDNDDDDNDNDDEDDEDEDKDLVVSVSQYHLITLPTCGHHCVLNSTPENVLKVSMCNTHKFLLLTEP